MVFNYSKYFVNYFSKKPQTKSVVKENTFKTYIQLSIIHIFGLI